MPNDPSNIADTTVWQNSAVCICAGDLEGLENIDAIFREELFIKLIELLDEFHITAAFAPSRQWDNLCLTGSSVLLSRPGILSVPSGRV